MCVTVWSDKTSSAPNELSTVYFNSLKTSSKRVTKQDQRGKRASNKKVAWYLFVLCSLKQKRCGQRLFAEAWISNMMDWKFCPNSIFEINLTLLKYEILEKLVTYVIKIFVLSFSYCMQITIQLTVLARVLITKTQTYTTHCQKVKRRFYRSH